VFGSWLLLLIQARNSRRSGRLLDVLVGTDSDVVVGSRKLRSGELRREKCG